MSIPLKEALLLESGINNRTIHADLETLSGEEVLTQSRPAWSSVTLRLIDAVVQGSIEPCTLPPPPCPLPFPRSDPTPSSSNPSQTRPRQLFLSPDKTLTQESPCGQEGCTFSYCHDPRVSGTAVIDLDFEI